MVRIEKTVGVLDVQGAVREHLLALKTLGVKAVSVKRPEDFDGLDGLIIPGGESTAIGRLIREQGLEDRLRAFHNEGKGIFGTCAGLILCSTDHSHKTNDLRLGFIDMDVERNGFGRQVASFEMPLKFEGIDQEVEAVFIRAPYIQSVGPGVKVLASVDDKIVAAEHENVLVTAHHPELTEDYAVLNYFLDKFVDGSEFNA
ncbi:5'-phosphate synthase pdxT subunit [Alkalibacterium putridalgicola]|uniref:Pyridoxal 5'-phosphate synthase subunit PdxT n=1 Tax=Alkalibacterium putridalgicola TaxID=426703 RepID=A0A1H7VMM8_9LACT|nr:pyridoxal 5'-phosphate synthase glutaminase subunit PdxT [Alkalibacterium putridalgicola]GEK89423.1 pyridoxal 5'-phosphate synthase subunit PdxT [Alkalibacterium putridalgicola]SEM10047.1 5'-phosphate synthase pdxT subunit [Alkalibacterium putridalgicola]